ncbi:hypothetical protein HAZT_HAZT009521 [Hyalella azteca]|uniref:Uncharacterized protein n=1 Tax=Hyalella azteca TaxID=294128 RepID=A0A6A0H6P2_HYAAZ|nr:hypothetical protein HAZT_HAZT009521 [Hyalella azteca]
MINIQKIEQEELSLKREELSLKQKELEFKHARSKAEIDKGNLETILLEQALNEIDGHVELTVHVIPTGPTPQTHDANQLLHFLSQQNEISRSMLSQRDQASLSKKHLEPFDGTNITKFKMFLYKFELLIESKCNTEVEKLTYLEQFTKGQAFKLVQSCSTCHPSVGYAKAKELLIAEYGNDFKIANAYLETLSDWPEIEPEAKDSLLELSTFLIQCQHFLENGPLGSQLDNPKEMMNLVMKLPFKARERWRIQTLDISKNAQRNVMFSDLVIFVQNEASLVRQPLFGTIVDATRRKNKPETTVKSKTRVTAAVEISSSDRLVEATSEENPSRKKRKRTRTECKSLLHVGLSLNP